jgi:hypothetical protein
MKINSSTCIIASCAILTVTLLAQNNNSPQPQGAVPDKDALTVSSLKAVLHVVASERKWQYKETTPGTNLNEMGRQGWELVAVVSSSTDRSQYWKRPLPE